MKQIKGKRQNGFSMLEVLIAAFFLGTALIGILGSIISNTILVGLDNEKASAIYQLQIVLEEMQALNTDEITSTNWQVWAQSNLAMPLPNESLSVTFPDGAYADPLKINATISWNYKSAPVNMSVEFLKAGS